jgi:hypothetical protein
VYKYMKIFLCEISTPFSSPFLSYQYSSFDCRTTVEEIEEKVSRAKKDEIEYLTGLLKKVLNQFYILWVS